MSARRRGDDVDNADLVVPVIAATAVAVIAATAILASILDLRAAQVPLWLSLPAVASAAVLCWWGAIIGVACAAIVVMISGKRRLGGADALWTIVAGGICPPAPFFAWALLLLVRACMRARATPLAIRAVPVLVTTSALAAFAGLRP